MDRLQLQLRHSRMVRGTMEPENGPGYRSLIPDSRAIIHLLGSRNSVLDNLLLRHVLDIHR